MKQSFTTDELKKMKKSELYQLAQKLSIKGRSTMSKVQLLNELTKLDQLKSVVEDSKTTPENNIKSKNNLTKEASPKKKKIGDESKAVSSKKTIKNKKKASSIVPPKKGATKASAISANQDNDDATPEDNVKDILSRSFGKKKGPDGKNKKGARVTKSSESYDTTDGYNNKENKSGSDKIANQSRNLKTTMEIPVFPVPLPSSVQTVDEKDLTGDLPQDYGEPRIVIQIRDPHLIHAYWEIPQAEKRRLEMSVGIFEFIHSHYVLRVHNVSDGASYDVRVPQDARGWYIQLERAMTVYQVEVGLVSPTEGYNFIALSNLVETPPDTVAANWAPPAYIPVQQQVQQANLHQEDNSHHQLNQKADMTNKQSEDDKATRRIAGHEVPSEIPEKIQNLSNPWSVFGVQDKSKSGKNNQVINPFPLRATMPSSDTVKSSSEDIVPVNLPSSMPSSMLDTMPSSMLDNMPSSFDMPSSDNIGGSVSVAKVADDKKIKKEKDFWLVVNTELILYGATEPDAKVTVQGQAVKLNPDGTFMLKYALPDGIIELPVKAVNADGDMERFVMPVVTRQTY